MEIWPNFWELMVGFIIQANGTVKFENGLRTEVPRHRTIKPTLEKCRPIVPEFMRSALVRFANAGHAWKDGLNKTWISISKSTNTKVIISILRQYHLTIDPTMSHTGLFMNVNKLCPNLCGLLLSSSLKYDKISGNTQKIAINLSGNACKGDLLACTKMHKTSLT